MTDEEKKLKRSERRKKNLGDIPEGEPVPATKLRFPIIKKTIEYLDIIKGGQILHTYKKEIVNLKWRELKERLFQDGIPVGKYSYAMKFDNSSNIYRGFINSINSTGKVEMNTESPDLKKIQSTIASLEQKLKSATPGGEIGITYILEATKSAHQAEIAVLRIQIANYEQLEKSLRKEIEDLNQELDKAELQLADFQQQGSLTKYLDMAMSMMNSNKKPSMKLSGKFDDSDIPSETIAVLAQVDYNNIPPENLEKLNNALNMFIHNSHLPLKGN